MKVLLGHPRCHCAGVERAVKIVQLALARFGPPVYIRKEIVHNSYVVARLREQGAVFVDELSQVPAQAVAVFSAHGVAPAVYREAQQRRLQVIDATCPLVRKVHAEVARFAAQGYHVILIGRAGHDEVVGTVGQAPENITLIENEQQAWTVAIPRPEQLAVVTQTTLSVDDAEAVLAALRERFAAVHLPPAGDICYATQNRQNAVKAMCARGIDLLLVAGSPNSSNAARLVEIGQVRGVRSRRLDRVEDLCGAWFADVRMVGVTGGASTPEEIVQAVLERLKDFGGGEAETCSVADEHTVFTLPEMLS